MEITSRRKHPFYIVDNAFLDFYGPEIGPYGIAVYNALCRYARFDQGEGMCYPSMASIAKRTGMSRRKVISTMKQLVDLGFVEVDRRYSLEGDRTSNLHILLNIDPTAAMGQSISALSSLPVESRAP